MGSAFGFQNLFVRLKSIGDKSSSSSSSSTQKCKPVREPLRLPCNVLLMWRRKPRSKSKPKFRKKRVPSSLELIEDADFSKPELLKLKDMEEPDVRNYIKYIMWERFRMSPVHAHQFAMRWEGDGSDFKTCTLDSLATLFPEKHGDQLALEIHRHKYLTKGMPELKC